LGLNEGGARNLTENWPYLGNSESWGQGYYQSLIENGIHPFAWNENRRNCI